MVSDDTSFTFYIVQQLIYMYKHLRVNIHDCKVKENAIEISKYIESKHFYLIFCERNSQKT